MRGVVVGLTVLLVLYAAFSWGFVLGARVGLDAVRERQRAPVVEVCWLAGVRPFVLVGLAPRDWRG